MCSAKKKRKKFTNIETNNIFRDVTKSQAINFFCWQLCRGWHIFLRSVANVAKENDEENESGQRGIADETAWQ